MIRKGFRIDPHTTFAIEDRGQYDDTRIDDMYYQYCTGNNKKMELVPIAYIYPAENEAAVVEALNKLKLARAAFELIQSQIFYKVLPSLRVIKGE